MKYPKFLQMLTLAAVVTSAVPMMNEPVYASDGKETPGEYEARTEYSLPEGYHYILSGGKYVVFDDSGKARVEKDESKETAQQKETQQKETQQKETQKNTEPEQKEAVEADSKAASEQADASDSKEASEQAGEADSKMASEKTEEKKASDKDTAKDDTSKDSRPDKDDREIITSDGTVSSGKKVLTQDDINNPDREIITTEDSETGGSSEETPGEQPGDQPGGGNGEEIPGEQPGDQPGDGNGEEIPGEQPGNQPGDGSSEETPGEQPGDGTGAQDPDTPADGAHKPGESGTETVNREPAVTEGQNEVIDSDKNKKKKMAYKLEPRQTKKTYDLDFKASKPFTAIGNRICYNVEVPIEGIPSFITQEMVVGALKAQDETGFPASVTIAQIINESGYGKYGPGGENGQGLSYLAYQYCNLFGIKGTGTAGSAVMNTKEMTPGGVTYSTRAGFRAYNTYTECIEDRSELLKNVYSDLTANVTDANTFAMSIGGRWATSIHYGQGLIKTMETYDLYRLDEMTLIDFNKMIGTFANPCPGSHITSSFGYRSFDDKFHKGLDMGTGSQNIPTYAAEAGTVTYAGSAGAAGNLIIIDHGNGLVTKYMHHSQIYVKLGQQVEKGQQIGLSGTTGRSTGNHLHFQVEKDGIVMNPMIYLINEL